MPGSLAWQMVPCVSSTWLELAPRGMGPGVGNGGGPRWAELCSGTGRRQKIRRRLAEGFHTRGQLELRGCFAQVWAPVWGSGPPGSTTQGRG